MSAVVSLAAGPSTSYQPPRVLVVTADMGAGHREVAGELAHRLQVAGASCTVVDIVTATGSSGRRLQSTYRRMLDYAPWFYDGVMRFWARWPAPLERVTAAGAHRFERLLATEAAESRADVIVSTFNLASQCLGRLRRRGAVAVPVVTLVTDPGAHPYWVSADIDLHLAPTHLTADRLAAMGAPRVAVTAPVLRAEFSRPPARDIARQRLGLPPDRHVVLLTAGSWAAGNIARTIDLLAEEGPRTQLLVLCGRDGALYDRLRTRPSVEAVPWTPDVALYLVAADVVVDNAGGLTCWEALACGRPVVFYDPLPGHGRLNVAALAELDLAIWARSPAELLAAVRRPRPPSLRPAGGDAAELVLSAAGVSA
jgi:UDP-N-acetylglucosamine:LPS N-acetylglucosamine transferase